MFKRPFRTQGLVLPAALCLVLAGCGNPDDAGEAPGDAGVTDPSTAASRRSEVRFTLNGQEFVAGIGVTSMSRVSDADAESPSILLRVLAGWINRTRAAADGDSPAPVERKSGVLTVTGLIKGDAPGAYPLSSEASAGGGPAGSASLSLPEEDGFGLPAALTSQSGTLTLHAIKLNDATRRIEALHLAFDGTFAAPDGTTQEVQGEIRLVERKKK